MNLTIVGSSGFIGSNLTLDLTDDKRLNALFKITSESSRSDLEDAITNSHAVVNLAGINRSQEDQDFFNVNVEFAKVVAQLVKDSDKCETLIYLSSIHAGRSDVYGQSKEQGEQEIKRILDQSSKNLFIERFPGIFGKNAKPNYNSVISTFCHNLANGLEIKINDPEHKIKIAYIDDVIEHLKNLIFKEKYSKPLSPIYEATVGEIAQHLSDISNDDNFIPNVGNELVKKLHSTYLFYLKPERFVKNLKVHEDKRGAFAEIVKTSNGGQFSYVIANPGETRGMHYHHTKTEKFLVLYGKALFKQKNMFTGEIHEFILEENKPKTIDSIPGYTHSIENIGQGKMIAVIWCNEIFDESRPDTFYEEI